MKQKKQHQKKILIVEDEMPVAQTLQLKLRNQGFDTLHAPDGEKALLLLKQNVFDLILLDIIMPKKDGFDVLRTVKKTIPVCVLTNLCQEEDSALCKKLGAYRYFIKSETPLSDIVKHINEILQ